MIRLRLMVPMFVVGMFWSSFLLGEDKKTAKEPIIVSKRLPANYSKLNLSKQQKDKIYRIRGKYEVEIQELTEKISELREQEKADCEGVLTPEQLARYRQILLGSDRKGSTDAKNTEAKDKKKDMEAKNKKKDAAPKEKIAPSEIKK